jgi:hypothetical protein
MSRRLDFNRDFRRRQAAYGFSVKDEAEWMENDTAARWLRRNRQRTSQIGDRRPSVQKPASSEVKSPSRTSQKNRLADIDPCNPHDQLEVSI